MNAHKTMYFLRAAFICIYSKKEVEQLKRDQLQQSLDLLFPSEIWGVRVEILTAPMPKGFTALSQPSRNIYRLFNPTQ